MKGERNDDREWGLGDESPAIFGPTAFDARWARVAAEAHRIEAANNTPALSSVGLFEASPWESAGLALTSP